MKRILLLEDDERLRTHLSAHLSREGFLVALATSLEEARAHIDSGVSFDGFVLDRLIGSQDSQDLVPTLRRRWPHAAIMILSAINTPAERTALLNVGADDYVGKPFSLSEVIARVHALMRRSGRPASHISSLGNTIVDHHNRQMQVAGRTCQIPAKEFMVLRTLSQTPGRIYSRDELLDIVWGASSDPESNVVEVTVAHLRRRLSELGSDLAVKNSRNLGYWIES